MKATFQKPDATYPHGSLREQPESDEYIINLEIILTMESGKRVSVNLDKDTKKVFTSLLFNFFKDGFETTKL